MRWINGDVAWEAKAAWLEVSYKMFESGRICHEATCTARNEIAFMVEREGHRWRVGFCGQHAVDFATEHHDIIIGQPKRLGRAAVLHGPMADEGMDELGDDDQDDP